MRATVLGKQRLSLELPSITAGSAGSPRTFKAYSPASKQTPPLMAII